MREPKKVRTEAELAKSCRMLREHNEKLKGRIAELEATIKAIRELPRYKAQVHWRSQSFSGMRQTVIAGHELLEDCGEWISADELEVLLPEE